MVKVRKNKKKRKSTGSSSSTYRQAALKRATETLLDTTVSTLEFPGGKSRESYRLVLHDGNTVIATRRDTIERARLEVKTLQALNRHNVAVPRLLANNHTHILIQEDVGGVRLSEALFDADMERGERLLDNALDTLAAIQQAASAEHLEMHVEALGDEDTWIQGLLQRPEVLGKYLKQTAPELDVTALVKHLRIVESHFVKWDARPGNALVRNDDSVVWIDWEHAGKRNRLDDMAWVLGDEYIPDWPELEDRLLARYIPRFAGSMSESVATDYLMAYGSFHMVVRLGLILKYMDGQWWDLERCLAEDKVGVTLECAQRLCQRGARWSARNPLTAPLSKWFLDIEPRIEALAV